jgi:hypothetical protein
MPVGFRLSDVERSVLNALGESQWVSAAVIGTLADVADGAEWMDAFVGRLRAHGLDIVDCQNAPLDPAYGLKR